MQEETRDPLSGIPGYPVPLFICPAGALLLYA